MQKLLKIFCLGGENYNQRTSKSGGFFHENHFLWRGKPVGTMKSHKKYKIFKNFFSFKKHKKRRLPKKTPLYYQKVRRLDNIHIQASNCSVEVGANHFLSVTSHYTFSWCKVFWCEDRWSND